MAAAPGWWRPAWRATRGCGGSIRPRGGTFVSPAARDGGRLFRGLLGIAGLGVLRVVVPEQEPGAEQHHGAQGERAADARLDRALAVDGGDGALAPYRASACVGVARRLRVAARAPERISPVSWSTEDASSCGRTEPAGRRNRSCQLMGSLRQWCAARPAHWCSSWCGRHRRRRTGSRRSRPAGRGAARSALRRGGSRPRRPRC